MELFYNDKTIFLKDIILSNDDIKFLDIDVQTKESITIKKIVLNEFVQYTEEDFKNNLVILLRNSNNNIQVIKNLYDVYNNIDNDNNNKSLVNDNNLIPIIFINKKFYTNEFENRNKNEDIDNIALNTNENIIKLTLTEELKNKNNINNESYQIAENLLYNYSKPFEDSNNNINNMELLNYIPEFNRDSITHCILNNEPPSGNNQCVDLSNDSIKIETFRILKAINIMINKNLINLYNGDNVKIVGYINKIPSRSETYSIFNIDEYIENIDNLEINQKITLYSNINLDNNNNKFNGFVKSIKNNIITIKIDQKIKINNINTNTIIYNKDTYNNFYIYPIDEKNIYHKNLLNNNIIAFKFSKENYDKVIKFIYPNIYQLISYIDNIYNFNDIRNVLKSYNYNINQLNDNDVQIINQKIENLVSIEESKPIEKLNKAKLNFNKISSNKYDLINLDKLPSNYSKIPSFIEDNKNNRYRYITNNDDLGYIHFYNKLKLNIENYYKDVKDIDFKNELELLEKDKIKLEEKIKEYDDKDECKQIVVEKIYYDVDKFEKDQGKDKYYDKYVVLTQNNISTLFLMKRGTWNKVKIIDDPQEIKICDGKYYYQEIKKNKCTYDNIDKLCQKREHIQAKNKLKNIKIQIDSTKHIKNFSEKNKQYIESINKIINDYENIHNHEYIFNQVTYKKKKSQKKYIGNEDYVDFSQQFDNIDINNIQTFNPLENTTEIINPFKDTKNFLLIEKILNIIGIELNISEKLYIYESLDYINSEFFNLKILSIKKDNPKLTIPKIIAKMKNENKYNNEKNKINILVISSLIIIISQIQFPNIEFNRIYPSCENIFTIDGFPKDDDVGERQFYKYVSCVLDKEFSEFKISKDIIKRVIKFVLKKKDFLETSIQNTKLKKIKDESNIYRNIWNGFKPELEIKKKPENMLGKYIYEINNIIKNSKIYNFNIFRKPLNLNLCCLEIINNKLNYHNLTKNKIDYNYYINSIKSLQSNTIQINKITYNVMNKHIYSNYDNIYIFNQDNIIDNDNKAFNKFKEIENDYNDYSKKIKKIIENQDNILIKENEKLINLINNFDVSQQWYNFSNEIRKLFNLIIEFTDDNSELINENHKKKLERYLVTLEDVEDLINLKKVMQNFNSKHINNIISRIKNYSEINKINKSYLDINEKIIIDKINNNNNINKYVESISELDLLKDFDFNTVFNKNFTDINVDTYHINLSNSINNNNNIKNDVKNIYLLNYIFLLQIMYIFSGLINDEPELFESKDLIDELGTLIKNESEYKFKIVVDTVAFILTELLNEIEINEINNDDLKSNMDRYREERKNEKLNKFQDLDIDQIDTLKLLKDVVGLEYEYDITKTSSSFEENVNKRDVDNMDLNNQMEENLNYTSYLNDYQGENADDENDYDDSFRS